MNIRILSESDVRAVIDMAAAIDIQAEAFTLAAEGRSMEGLRSFAVSEDPPGIAIFNPAFLTEGAGYGVKVVSDFYGNTVRGAPRMTALVALFDGETGRPRTVMEGGFLTDLRTGAGTALAARYLARANSRSLVLIGAGRVARNQLEALAASFPIERVRIATRTEARAHALIARIAESEAPMPGDIALAASAEEAVRDVDMVVCATTSSAPVLEGAWLKPGTFVAAAGANQATAREVDGETIRRARRLFIDSRADSLANAGDLQVPLGEGAITASDIGEIAELVSGRRPGRQEDDEITYYKSIGVPIQDLITAQHIERRAIDHGIGTVIDIGGDRD
jgi:ornithine cyclodeaminase/alanine dehydrogenase-like protein (mu-crystallin family)